MPLPHVVPLYAGLLALAYVWLALRVVRLRRNRGVSLGDGTDSDLLVHIRIHGNFAEYVPISLILLLMAELQGAPVWLLHGLCVMLLAGRLLHMQGLARGKRGLRLRAAGMVLTFAVLSLTGIGLMGHSLL
ncbi:MAPEG family protein [Phaeovulum sp. W22_SRMD_FR3]|uniref:MAPEG family protein n=1 Tax=Phaeovulum sp. W22_SRMD_FR3 TaxID=3240274 RepID=UPI003F946435